MLHIRRTISGNLPAVVALLSVLVVAADAAPVVSRPTRTGQKALAAEREKQSSAVMKKPSRDIQGFRTGMGVREVRRLLAKKKVTEYETGFSDLFVYAPARDAEIKLLFTCGAKEYILSNVELSTKFPVNEADSAIAVYWDKLIAKYGPPVRSDAGPGSMNLCWGACEGPGVWRLDAKTTAPENGTIQLVAMAGDDSLVRACNEQRRTKIDRWLRQWVVDIQRFSPGMGLKSASAAYQKRFQDRLVTGEARDEGSGEYPVVSLVSTNQDYFAGLDYESLFFEGEGPGSVMLKFTGNQAGKGNPLNGRLYYLFFSTTRFTDKHLYPDMQGKLDLFIKAFGNPVETTKQQDRITARWVQGAKQQLVTIEDSGLISFEQSDLALKEAYRDAAVQKLVESGMHRFEQDLF